MKRQSDTSHVFCNDGQSSSRRRHAPSTAPAPSLVGCVDPKARHKITPHRIPFQSDSAVVICSYRMDSSGPISSGVSGYCAVLAIRKFDQCESIGDRKRLTHEIAGTDVRIPRQYSFPDDVNGIQSMNADYP